MECARACAMMQLSAAATTAAASTAAPKLSQGRRQRCVSTSARGASSSSSSSSSSLLSLSKRRGPPPARAELLDFVGGDFVSLDVGSFVDAVESNGAVAMLAPAEGGYEGRYALALRREGYYIINKTAKGLGNIETDFTKVHAIRPPHLGKQEISRFYFPGEIDLYRKAMPDAKGLLFWIQEAKVLSKQELTTLVTLSATIPDVFIVAEVGVERFVKFLPLLDYSRK